MNKLQLHVIMCESHKYIAEQKKPNAKEYILCNSFTYISERSKTNLWCQKSGD